MTGPAQPAPPATAAGPTTAALPTTPPTTAVPPPTKAAAPVRLGAEAARALQAALAAEQVAVWAYDLVAAYDSTDADTIAAIRAGHLARAGATASLLVSGGAAAPDAAAAYALPGPVTDASSARALTAVVEGDCAAAWRAVIGASDMAVVRSAGLAGLSDSAVWLTTLKLAAKTTPATVPLPGQR